VLLVPRHVGQSGGPLHCASRFGVCFGGELLSGGGCIVRNVFARNVERTEAPLTSWMNTLRASGSSGIDLVSVSENCDALGDLVVSISWGWSRFGCDDGAVRGIFIASDSGLSYDTTISVSQWLLF
jgi:hypothetical protein